MKEFWDFDENVNYVSIKSKYNGQTYNVLIMPDKLQAVKLLSQIDNYIAKISLKLFKMYNFLPEKLKTPAFIFLNIHPNNHKLFEMQLNTDFEGLNKPKNVKINKQLPPLGKDGYLKASKRYVFLELRDSRRKLRTFKNIRPLVIHELAHTMANHVTWRDDDHGNDFNFYYYFLNNM